MNLTVTICGILIGLLYCLNQIACIPTTCTKSFEECYVEIPTTTPGSLEYIPKCGEGDDAGRRVCAQYYRCTVDKFLKDDDEQSEDYFGELDIRGSNHECNHYLEVCCKFRNASTSTTTNKPDIPSTITEATLTRPTRPPKPPGCGVRNENGVGFRITGDENNEAEFGEFPWMVAILTTGSSYERPLLCGGSLITPEVVLTGAHCVYKYSPSEIKIRAGEWDTQTENEQFPYQERLVTSIIRHNEFNNKTLYNNFALLFLDKPVIMNENVGTICLPRQHESIDSKHCFATGWGKDLFGIKGVYQAILKKVELPTVEHSQCESALRQSRLGENFKLHSSFMCAGGESGKDTCSGDGGSPLVCPDPTNPLRFVQAGIVSWGIECGVENRPGVYGDVTQFRTWIDEQLAQRNIDTKSYQ